MTRSVALWTVHNSRPVNRREGERWELHRAGDPLIITGGRDGRFTTRKAAEQTANELNRKIMIYDT